MKAKIEVFTPSSLGVFPIPTEFEVSEVEIIVSVKTTNDGFSHKSVGHATPDYSFVDTTFQDLQGGQTYRRARFMTASDREIVAAFDRVNGVKTKVHTARINSFNDLDEPDGPYGVKLEVLTLPGVYQYEIILRG